MRQRVVVRGTPRSNPYRQARWARTSSGSLLGDLVGLVVLGVVLAVMRSFDAPGRWQALVLAAAALTVLTWLWRLRALTERLAADDTTIRLGGRQVAWTSVQRVDVALDRVRVTMPADAPMPDWLTSRIYDPQRPDDGITIEETMKVPPDLSQRLRQLAPAVAFTGS